MGFQNPLGHSCRRQQKQQECSYHNKGVKTQWVFKTRWVTRAVALSERHGRWGGKIRLKFEETGALDRGRFGQRVAPFGRI